MRKPLSVCLDLGGILFTFVISNCTTPLICGANLAQLFIILSDHLNGAPNNSTSYTVADFTFLTQYVVMSCLLPVFIVNLVHPTHI